MVTELLGIGQANVVVKLEVEESTATACREIEGAQEKVSLTLPAVVSAQKGLNEPRYETLKGIMMTKKKEIPMVTIEELGLKPEEIAPRVAVVKMDLPPVRKAGRVVTGEAAETARRIVEYLHAEAKVI
jgi:electron transfer flavoprotein beta subunit